MRISILPAVCALVVSALALPGSSSEVEKRQTVNVPWFITNWNYYPTNNETHKRSVRFMIGAPDAYVGGFYGFSGWCDPVPVNWWNTTLCFAGGDQWRVETKVTHNRVTNHTGIWVRHTQNAFGRIATATGSTDNFVQGNQAFELYPTDIEGF
ncbi:hypothetical protein F4820DRAFT_440027 [Hypoxylon rubiginosum]|uniref:Uncharacterized protein n=1 Tax=Hypoxylon rubiginosum TaxID=110542 RepID=A0ACB9YJY6_9PEZI|nr:hypothetical protein F4820DRAFT_440027 [Hypoxylon rubiginosum]